MFLLYDPRRANGGHDQVVLLHLLEVVAFLEDFDGDAAVAEQLDDGATDEAERTRSGARPPPTTATLCPGFNIASTTRTTASAVAGALKVRRLPRTERIEILRRGDLADVRAKLRRRGQLHDDAEDLRHRHSAH